VRCVLDGWQLRSLSGTVGRCAGELVACVLTDAACEVRLTLCRRGDRVRVAVDGGEECGEGGLARVGRHADRWGADVVAGGTTVWAEFCVAGGRLAS
jgi:hypothetical protein